MTKAPKPSKPTPAILEMAKLFPPTPEELVIMIELSMDRTKKLLDQLKTLINKE